MRAAFDRHTKAIILNTPNNPTGKVFTRAELELIRDLCIEFDVLAITDEIYEHILYDGAEHISMASLEGMRERTVTINGMSKTYSVTGWRVGWAVGAGEDHKCDPEGARLSDSWRSGTAAGSRSGGFEFAGGILREAGRRIPCASRSFDSGARGGRLSLLSSARSVLRNDGYFWVWI